MRIITKIKASKWGGKYVPVAWRVDEVDANGVYIAKIGIFNSLKEAEKCVNNG